MRIEVLYFDGCPHHRAVLARLRELIREASVNAAIELTRVESAAAAERARFLGSPTVRIDGEDVERSSAARSDFGLKCRLYTTPDGLRGVVPDELMIAALTSPRSHAKDAR